MKRILGTLMILAFASFTNAQTNPASQPAAAPALTDNEITKVLMTINEGELDAAKIAKSKAQSGVVKDFANMMADQHNQNVKDTKELCKKDKLEPVKTSLSKDLEKQAKNENKDLKKLKNEEFDRKYVAQQIAMHQKALATLRETLIPNAKNADLQAHLKATEMAVASHLEHAQGLEKQLQ